MPLATIKLISDPEAARVFLWPHLKRAFPTWRYITNVNLRPLGSVQAGRGVVRITVRAKAAHQKTNQLTLFGNYDAGGGSQTIYQFLCFLQRHGFGPGQYGAPRPLLYSEPYKLLVYESFPGRRVRDELEAGRLTVRTLMTIMRQTAGWLKKFHRLPARVGKRRTLVLSAAKFSRLAPTYRRAIGAAIPLVNRLLQVASRQPRSLVHGDPHLANAILGPHHTFALIDFSESYAGHPLADPAMFIIHLDVALKQYFSRPDIARLQTAFLTAYFNRPVDSLSRETANLFAAYQVRTAAEFLQFTANHHQRPSPDVRWIIQRLLTIIESGAEQLRRGAGRPILSL